MSERIVKIDVRNVETKDAPLHTTGFFDDRRPTYGDRCICCGEFVPEGRQICGVCERT